jgi:hypothetical protein
MLLLSAFAAGPLPGPAKLQKRMSVIDTIASLTESEVQTRGNRG